MSFFIGEKLYRVEVIRECPIMDVVQNIFGRSYFPSINSLGKGKFGFIPVGIKGWVMEKYGKQYFLVDENQDGLDLFMPFLQEDTLIPYNKVKEYCKAL